MTAPEPDFGSRAEFYTFAPETLDRELPEFEIVREIGKGSMAIVYEAIRRSDRRRVALKVLPPSLTLSERALARFLRESEVMARIEHEAIVQVLDHGRKGRLHYFVMEFVRGVTLAERTTHGPLPARQAAKLCAQVARALHFAHERGVVHRDVKPGNLMLREDGNVVITDFGLARETGTGSLTESGMIVGTPIYMSPEQVLGERGHVGTRSDVYSLGATLYHLVTGGPPFAAPTAQAVLKAVLEHDPAPPTVLQRDLPRQLEAVIQKAMEKAPGRRYGTALELAEDLERFVAGVPVLARHRGPFARLVRRALSRPMLVVLVLVIVGLAIGAIVLHLDRQRWLLETQLAEAEFALVQASSTRDPQMRLLTGEQRKERLQHALNLTDGIVSSHPSVARAFFLRAKARHRLQDFRGALADLDACANLTGSATSEVLRLRIDSTSRLHDPESIRRLQLDLARLLELEPDNLSRALVVEHLLAFAAEAAEPDRSSLLASARKTLAPVTTDDSQTLIARARLHELSGDPAGAELYMRQALGEYAGNAPVHGAAAQLFARLGLADESRQERDLARMLDPESAAEQVPEAQSRPALDLGGVQGFLERLDGLMRASSRPKDGR